MCDGKVIDRLYGTDHPGNVQFFQVRELVGGKMTEVTYRATAFIEDGNKIKCFCEKFVK